MSTQTDIKKRCYSINEVKTMYSLGRTSLYELMNAGKLKFVKIGRRRMITAAALDEFDELLKTEERIL